MKRLTLKNKVAAVAVTGGLIAGVTGAAYAYFTADGSGSGSINTATPEAVTVNLVSTDAAPYPGGQSTVTANVHNPNGYSITLNAPSTFTVATDNANSTCKGDYTPHATNRTQTVPAGSDATVLVGTVSMADNGNQTSCEGEQLDITAAWTHA